MNKELKPGPPSPSGKEPEDGAFYIGWMPKAPKSFAKRIKRVLLILFPVALIIAYLLSTSQKKFSMKKRIAFSPAPGSWWGMLTKSGLRVITSPSTWWASRC